MRVRDNYRCRWSWSMSPPSTFRNFTENPQFCMFFSPSIWHNSISHFALYQHPPPKGTAIKNQKLTFAALGGKQFRWAMQQPVWQKRSVFCLCYSLWYFMLSYTTVYINCHSIYSILIAITTKMMEQSIFVTNFKGTMQH